MFHHLQIHSLKIAALQNHGQQMLSQLFKLIVRQIPVVMFRYDGTLLLSSAKNQARWMGDGLSYTMNFLEGNGGLWWAQIDTKFDPAFILACAGAALTVGLRPDSSVRTNEHVLAASCCRAFLA